MDTKNRVILEALQMQPLSQEEMTARHILGRLYGPIATCIESTRNGRLYNKPLWEKALKDEIFLEKVATKALFLELGHPADREETDMKQACACIPEVPKIVGDDLYAYVDILDTPNGRLLKTLVDYGFVPGISSRGSGDVMDNNQVDPETFFLETWDIVQLPAVKKARLNVCESLDSSSLKLKKALAESYKAAKEEDKDTMKKALENLNIDINENLAEELETDAKADKASIQSDEESKKDITAEDVPWDPEADEVLLEDADDEEADDTADAKTEGDADTAEEPASEDITEVDADEETAEAPAEETVDEADEADEAEQTIVDITASGESDLSTVGDAIKLLKNYDKNAKVVFNPITIDGTDYTIDKVSYTVDKSDEEETLVLCVNCVTGDEVPADADVDIDAIDTEEEAVETIEEVDNDPDTAEDTGDAEVIESLKEMIRQKEALETEVSDLRKAKAVGDTKEKELQEKLTKYRIAVKDMHESAADVTKLTAKVQELTEQLAQSELTIKALNAEVTNSKQLRESVDKDKTTVCRLTEELDTLNKKSAALEAKLEGQTKLYTKKLQERTDLAKSYKTRFIETLNRYVESKASMLGVTPSEITSRLNESYTLADVDAVCDQILDSTMTYSRLPFGGRTKTSARISESVNTKKSVNPEYGYEIDDSLLELAGLKK